MGLIHARSNKAFDQPPSYTDEVEQMKPGKKTQKVDLAFSAINALNRILNRPLQEQFIAEGMNLSDPILITTNTLFYNLINDPKIFHFSRNFMVKEA